MGYSKAIRAFNRVKGFLDEMVEKNETLIWPASDSAKLAYYIREGIKIAKERVADEKYPDKDKFRPYSSLSAKFIVRVKGATVVAEPREFAPNVSANDVLKRMVLEDVEGPLEIVGAAIKHKASEMFFPLGDRSLESLGRIYAWSSKHDYFIVSSDVGITLTKTDPGEIAWQPTHSSPRVFVTNYAGHDFEAAKQYGELFWITKGYVSFQSLDRIKFLITEQVVKSNKEDWLLLSGTPVISVIAVLVWYAIHKKVKLLVFDRKGEGKYRELIISETNVLDLLKVMPESFPEGAVANG